MSDNSTIIKNANILTMDNQFNVFSNGFVKIKNGLIESVGDNFEKNSQEAEKILDAKGGLVIPGLINCHTHAAMSLFRSLGDDEADRLIRYIFPLEMKHVSPEFVRIGTELSCAEMP